MRKEGEKKKAEKNKAKRCPIDASSLDVRYNYTNYLDIKIMIRKYKDSEIKRKI